MVILAVRMDRICHKRRREGESWDTISNNRPPSGQT